MGHIFFSHQYHRSHTHIHKAEDEWLACLCNVLPRVIYSISDIYMFISFSAFTSADVDAQQSLLDELPPLPVRTCNAIITSADGITSSFGTYVAGQEHQSLTYTAGTTCSSETSVKHRTRS
jgi:hypothetical protein